MPEVTTTEGDPGQGELPLLVNGRHAALPPTTGQVLVVFIHDCQRGLELVGMRGPGQHSYAYIPVKQESKASI